MYSAVELENKRFLYVNEVRLFKPEVSSHVLTFASKLES